MNKCCADAAREAVDGMHARACHCCEDDCPAHDGAYHREFGIDPDCLAAREKAVRG